MTISDPFPFLIHGVSWYDKKYGVHQGTRYPTMRAALNLLAQRTKDREFLIVETGCQRMEDDWGAGMSTTIFADFCRTYGGYIYSVDINPQNVELADKVTKEYSSHRSVTCSDSVQWLINSRNMDIDIDLLYLDSWDYPDGELRSIYGDEWDKVPYRDMHEKHSDLIKPCQEHCVKELVAALPLLTENSIILIDDSNLPGGGKAHLAREYLFMHGWTCVLDYQQSLWISNV